MNPNPIRLRPVRSRLALAVVLVAAAVAPGLAREHYEVTVERGVAVKMRDGVTLRADIYRPNAEGKFPLLLERTPYNKAGGVEFGLHAASLGYVVTIEDCRGRYSSEGEWYPFKHESDDGYDTVEWAAALPYSDGRVGMFGGSYVGATQMLAAIARPPHLGGICPVVTASNYHANWTWRAEEGFGVNLAILMSVRLAARPKSFEGERGKSTCRSQCPKSAEWERESGGILCGVRRVSSPSGGSGN